MASGIQSIGGSIGDCLTCLIENALIESDPKRPPIHLTQIASTHINLGSKVRQCPGFTVERFVGPELRSNILFIVSRNAISASRRKTHEIGQMDVALGI